MSSGTKGLGRHVRASSCATAICDGIIIFRQDGAILGGASALVCLRRKKTGGGEVEPLVAFDVVLRQTPSVVAHDAEIELRGGVSLIRGLAIPRDRVGGEFVV